MHTHTVPNEEINSNIIAFVSVFVITFANMPAESAHTHTHQE